MTLIKRLFLGLLTLILLLCVIALFLPREVQVERSVRINATPDVVFPYVNSLQRSEAWSPWLSKDPNVALHYSGPEQGVGNRLEWASDVAEVGNGSQEIIDSVDKRHVKTALDFGDMGIANAQFNLVAIGDQTDITWGLNTDMGYNPMMRWMGLMFDTWVGADYERGLANLKNLIEG